MNNNLNQVILITGASSGIGAALAEYYAKPGSTLALVARDETALQTVSQQCRTKGALTFEYVVDVTDVEGMKKCGKDLFSQVGYVDIVIANAGVRGEEDEDCQNVKIPEELILVNYLGVINTFSPFIKSMKTLGKGQLVAISSIASFRGTPNSGAYSASKAALNVWTESLRLRMLPFGISVTTICLGFVKTAMTEGLNFWMPGILEPEEAAALIAKCIEKKQRIVTLPWQSRFIWTVFRILPGWVYDRLIIWAKAHGPKR
jgi:short-subunit dehydrogenase